MIERLNQIIEERLDDNTLKNSEIANTFKMSKRTLTRKVKELTDMTPNEYIRYYRLHRAKDFLSEGKYMTVSEVANAVGIAKSGYFSNKFQELFNKKPLDILDEHGWR